MSKIKVWFGSFFISLFIGLLVLLPSLFWVDGFEVDEMFKCLGIVVVVGTPLMAWINLRRYKN